MPQLSYGLPRSEMEISCVYIVWGLRHLDMHGAVGLLNSRLLLTNDQPCSMHCLFMPYTLQAATEMHPIGEALGGQVSVSVLMKVRKLPASSSQTIQAQAVLATAQCW